LTRLDLICCGGSILYVKVKNGFNQVPILIQIIVQSYFL
jgi:hypothetical protein